MPAARSRDGRSVALGPWRPVSEREAIRRRIPALAARASSLADARHGDQVTGRSLEIAEGQVMTRGVAAETADPGRSPDARSKLTNSNFTSRPGAAVRRGRGR